MKTRLFRTTLLISAMFLVSIFAFAQETTKTDKNIFSEIVVTAKRKVIRDYFPRRRRSYTDSIVFNLSFSLPENDANNRSRIVIRPYLMSCEDDTEPVAVLEPIVIEGEKYKASRKDTLHKYVDSNLRISKETSVIHKTIAFKRPDSRKMYYCAANIVCKDKKHIIWSNKNEEIVFGPCYVLSPFKFVEYKVDNHYTNIPLDKEEFYEPPRIQPRDVTRNLWLSFVVGKAEFSSDSINKITLEKLASEIKANHKMLVSLTIIGTSSPEGDSQLNKNLVERRVGHVLSYIKSCTNLKNEYYTTSVETKLYTWLDVADSLMNRGYEIEATRIRDLATAKGEYSRDVYIAAKAMNIYASVITSILANMRRLTCSYRYITNSPLSVEEAAETWLTRNPDYLPGGTKRFSNGDYFNMLTIISDSVEQRRVVERAYKEITSRPGFKINAFAAYLANRMAIYKIQDGVIDTTLLEPFIDIYDDRCDAMKLVSIDNQERYKVNRNQIVANQALMYLKLGKLGYACMLLDKLPGHLGVKDEITKYADMINLVNYWEDPDLPDDERTKGGEALDYVMEKSSLNKAVLTAELHEELGIERMQAFQTVDSLMSDNDARKWYLMGMLISEHAGKEDEIYKNGISLADAYMKGLRADSLTANNVVLYRKLTSEEDMNLPEDLAIGEDGVYFIELCDRFDALMNQITSDDEKARIQATKDIPYFLAYMQHAFDLNPDLMKYYFREGNIPVMVHKKYPYNKKDAAKYREKFKMIEEK